jgi:carboxypeptidase T
VAVYSVTIVARTLEQVRALRAHRLDLHERAARRRPDSDDYAVPALLTDEQIELLRSEGYGVDVHEDAEQTAAERLAEVDPDVDRFATGPLDRVVEQDREADRETYEQASSAGRLERLMDLTEPDDTTAGRRDGGPGGERAVLGGYLTPDEAESALQVLAATYPEVASVTALPELSWDGRTSHVLRLAAGPERDRTGVLITGGVHAREWGGSDICVAFATNLARCYTAGAPLRYGGKTFTAADVRAILEHTDVFVVADVNPDGKAYSQTADPGRAQNFWWRKNRRTADMPPGTAGVDVNRNFDLLWASGIGTASNPVEFTYKGPACFSEPEARNIRWLCDTFDHIGVFVDVHSFGELILYSWGDDENQVDEPNQNFLNPAFDGKRGVVGGSGYREYITSDDQATVVDLAAGMNEALSEVRGKRYTVQQAVGLYPTSATSDDYAFSRHRVSPANRKIYGFTIEFGQQFVPPYEEMRKVMADVSAALTELCQRTATRTNPLHHSPQEGDMTWPSSDPQDLFQGRTATGQRLLCLECADHEEPDVRLAVANLSLKLTEVAQAVTGYLVASGRLRDERAADANEAADLIARILGGVDTQPGAYPDCALVGHQNTNGTYRWFCTGVLVHPSVVLTAGHCVRASVPINAVALNAVDFQNLENAEIIEVRRVVVNPLYTQRVRGNDISVLMLRSEATVTPIPVATTEELTSATQTTLVGFGSNNPYATKGFGTQREVTVDITQLRRSPEDNLDAVEHTLGFESDLEFIAGGNGYDSCNGDSGGPAYITTDGGRKVTGLTSRSTPGSARPCGEGGIYTRVDTQRPFIEQMLTDAGIQPGSTPACPSSTPAPSTPAPSTPAPSTPAPRRTLGPPPRGSETSTKKP